MSNEERRQSRSDRLFRLILVLQNRPNLSSKDLADHFEVSRRTIFRDLRALTDSGVPLTYGESGGYEILDSYQLPPLMLTAREAATLLVGVSFMRLQPDASLRTDADDVGLKIRAVLSPDVKEFIDRMLSHTVLDPYWLSSVHDDEATEGEWYRIGEAISKRKRLLLEYHVASRNEMTRRQVDPLGLVYYTDHWNLVAFDHLRSDIRNFRLDRINKLVVLNETFPEPADFDLEQYLLADRGKTDLIDFEVAFSSEAYKRARRTIPARLESEIERDGWVHVRFRFEPVDYITRWLLRFGREARAIEPAALREGVAEELQRWLAEIEPESVGP
jgi:predicted DNA-binding transcriptional regulator YafY